MMPYLFFLILITTSLLAKRIAPQIVEPIEVDGVRYSVPHDCDCISCVEAYYIDNDSLIWSKEIYEIEYDSTLEKDVQDVFIKELQNLNDSLIITDEKGNIYQLAL